MSAREITISGIADPGKRVYAASPMGHSLPWWVTILLVVAFLLVVAALAELQQSLPRGSRAVRIVEVLVVLCGCAAFVFSCR